MLKFYLWFCWFDLFASLTAFLVWRQDCWEIHVPIDKIVEIIKLCAFLWVKLIQFREQSNNPKWLFSQCFVTSSSKSILKDLNISTVINPLQSNNIILLVEWSLNHFQPKIYHLNWKFYHFACFWIFKPKNIACFSIIWSSFSISVFIFVYILCVESLLFCKLYVEYCESSIN